MNPQNNTEQEYLELLNKTEEEQQLYFTTIFDMKPINVKCCKLTGVSDGIVWQVSLADLAERLWEKAVQSDEDELDRVIVFIYEKTEHYALNHKNNAQSLRIYKHWNFRLHLASQWFLKKSKPIHRIVASLIALRRAGITEL